jgi:hypothetical protein
MGDVISNFYSLEREITFIVKHEKEVVVLFAAGIELQSCCQDCLFILAVEVHFYWSHLVYRCRVSSSSILHRPFLVASSFKFSGFSCSSILGRFFFQIFRVLGLSVCPMVTTFCDNFLTTV